MTNSNSGNQWTEPGGQNNPGSFGAPSGGGFGPPPSTGTGGGFGPPPSTGTGGGFGPPPSTGTGGGFGPPPSTGTGGGFGPPPSTGTGGGFGPPPSTGTGGGFAGPSGPGNDSFVTPGSDPSPTAQIPQQNAQPASAGPKAKKKKPAKGKKPSLPRPSRPKAGSSGNSKPSTMLMPSLVSGAIALIVVLVLLIGSFTATDGLFKILSCVAWVLAGVIGVALLSLYFKASANAKSVGTSITASSEITLYYVTLAVLGTGIVASAFEVALWVGKL